MSGNRYTRRRGDGTVTLALVACVAVISLFAVAYGAQTSDAQGPPDYGWYDSSVSEYTIGSAEAFVGFANMVNGADSWPPTDFTGKQINIAQSLKVINLGGSAWRPIGDAVHPFTGKFDGNGCMITNMVVSSSAAGAECGLFGRIGNGASVANISIGTGSSVSATGEGSTAGGIIGVVEVVNGFFTVSACYSFADVSVTGVSGTAGGIIGVARCTGTGGITVQSSYNTGTVSSSGGILNYAGGVVGHNIVSGAGKSTIQDSYNAGTVSVQGHDQSYAGGVVGYNGVSVSGGEALIQSCYNIGPVSATGTAGSKDCYAGGIAGYSHVQTAGGKTTVQNGYNTATITAHGNSKNCYASGGVGRNNGGTVINFSNSGNIKSESEGYLNGAGGAVGWNFNNTAGTALVANCRNTGSITASNRSTEDYSGSYAGGITASNDNGSTGTATVRNCYNEGTVTVAPMYSYLPMTCCAGGITGYQCFYLSGSNTAAVQDCFNSGRVIGTLNSVSNISEYLGGIVGCSYTAAGTVSVRNCYNSGALSFESLQQASCSVGIGGIVGWNYNYYGVSATVENCYNGYDTSQITVVPGLTMNIGGVVGINNHGTVRNCYWFSAMPPAAGASRCIGDSTDFTTPANCAYYHDAVGSLKTYSGTEQPYSQANILTALNAGVTAGWCSWSAESGSLPAFQKNTVTVSPKGMANHDYIYANQAGSDKLITLILPGHTFTTLYHVRVNGADLVRDVGYTFDEHSKVIKILNTVLINGSVEIYPKWEIKEYTIRFEPNGGTPGTADVKIQYEGTLSPIVLPSKAGHTFVNYAVEPAGGTAVVGSNRALVADVPGYTDAQGRWVRDSSVTLYAQWTINSYHISTVASPAEGGTTAGGGTFVYGTVVNIHAYPREGYVFLGWSGGGTGSDRTVTVTSNATYVALFGKLVKVTVTPESEAKGTTTGTGKYVQGSSVPISATPKEGYAFLKWNDGDKRASRTVMAEYDIEYTAYFGKTVTVTFNGGGSEPPIVKPAVEGEVIVIPEGGETPWKKFDGWEYDGKKYMPGDEFTVPGENVEIAACWSDYYPWFLTVLLVPIFLRKGKDEDGPTVTDE